MEVISQGPPDREDFEAAGIGNDEALPEYGHRDDRETPHEVRHGFEDPNAKYDNRGDI